MGVVRDFYLSKLQEHGPGNVRSLGWANEYEQKVRFDQFSFDFTNKRVLDVGCGFCDFAQYLVDKGQVPAYYIGVEMMPEFAKGVKLPCPGHIIIGEFLESDVPLVDIAVLNGSLNLPFHNFEPIVSSIFRKMYRLAAEGIGVTMLGSQNNGGEHEKLFSKEKWVRFARGLSRKVRLVDNYVPYDFLIEARK